MVDPAFFRALCEPNRLRLLERLARCGRPCSVSEMVACCPVDLSVVSRHLAVLRAAGIVEARKRGRQVYYSVCFPKVLATLRGLADALEAGCPQCLPQERRRNDVKS